MNRNQLIRLGMIVCAVAVLAAVGLAVSGVFGGGTGFSYANAEKYTAGETEIRENVRNLDIHWLDGEVNIAYHSGNTVLLRETADFALSGDQQLRWWMDGDTLRVQYAKPGIKMQLLGPKKKLTLTLPEGIELSEVRAEATSGDLHIPKLKAEKLLLATTSGDIRAEAETGELDAASTSGDQELKAAGSLKVLNIGATSGDIRLEAEKAETVKAGTTSGNMQLTIRELGTAELGGTSGNVTVRTGSMKSLRVSTTSGNVTAALPENPGFTARVSTVSGDLQNAVAMTGDGKEYKCGDGSAKAEIATVSGDIHIEAWKD